MSITLSLRTVELQLAIIEHLYQQGDRDTLCNWSCVFSFYRSPLIPYVFRRISLQNTEKSGSSVYALANSPYSKYVKELYYLGRALYDRDEESQFCDPLDFFPSIIHAI